MVLCLILNLQKSAFPSPCRPQVDFSPWEELVCKIVLRPLFLLFYFSFIISPIPESYQRRVLKILSPNIASSKEIHIVSQCKLVSSVLVREYFVVGNVHGKAHP